MLRSGIVLALMANVFAAVPDVRVASKPYLSRSETLNVEVPKPNRVASNLNYSNTSRERLGHYNYVPTVLQTDEGITHIWWCGNLYWGAPPAELDENDRPVKKNGIAQYLERTPSYIPFEYLTDMLTFATPAGFSSEQFDSRGYSPEGTDVIFHAIEHNLSLANQNSFPGVLSPQLPYNNEINRNAVIKSYRNPVEMVPELWGTARHKVYEDFIGLFRGNVAPGEIQGQINANQKKWNENHICDPSVIQLPNADKQYALYFTSSSFAGDRALGTGGDVGLVTANSINDLPVKWSETNKFPTISHLEFKKIDSGGTDVTPPYGIGQQTAVVKEGFVYLFVVELQNEGEPTDVWLYRAKDCSSSEVCGSHKAQNGQAFEPLFAITKRGLDTNNFSQTDFMIDANNFCSTKSDPVVYMQVGRNASSIIDIYRICWNSLSASKGMHWKKIDSVLVRSRASAEFKNTEFDLPARLGTVRKIKGTLQNKKTLVNVEYNYENIMGDSLTQHMAFPPTAENYRNLCHLQGGAFKRDKFGQTPKNRDVLEVYFGRHDGDPYCVGNSGRGCASILGRMVDDFFNSNILDPTDKPNEVYPAKPFDLTLDGDKTKFTYYDPPYSGTNIERYESTYKISQGLTTPLISLVRRTQYSPKFTSKRNPQNTFLFSSFYMDASITVPDQDDGKEGFVWIAMDTQDGFCFLDSEGNWEKVGKDGKIITNCVRDFSSPPPYAFHAVLHDTQRFPIRSLYKMDQKKICAYEDVDYLGTPENPKCPAGVEAKSVGYTVEQLEERLVAGVKVSGKSLFVAYGFPNPADDKSTSALASASAWRSLLSKVSNFYVPEVPLRKLSLTCWTACCTDWLTQEELDKSPK